MGLHQDKDEQDFAAPVVSLSLGDTGLFRVGGVKRSDPTRSVRLASGDAVVLGGEGRLAFHGVDRILPRHLDAAAGRRADQSDAATGDAPDLINYLLGRRHPAHRVAGIVVDDRDAADTRNVPRLAHDLAAFAGGARERGRQILHRHIGEPALGGVLGRRCPS